MGWFSRQHGLTCDQFAALELVLASGEVIEISADSHPDRFQDHAQTSAFQVISGSDSSVKTGFQNFCRAL
ncbi:MAG: hypothetical protein ACRDND_01260 [Streptosporangiaceae bacterium]